MEKIGITNQSIKSGPLKDLGSPLKTMTEEEKRVLQSVIDGMYERFLDRVMAGRPDRFTRDELRMIADGRVYTASQAVDLKLVDSVGYLDDAIDWAKLASGVKEARVVTYAQPRAYRNNIYSRAEPAPAGISVINIDAGIPKLTGMEFMYMWLP
jgi:protease-4